MHSGRRDFLHGAHVVGSREAGCWRSRGVVAGVSARRVDVVGANGRIVRISWHGNVSCCARHLLGCYFNSPNQLLGFKS